MEEFFQQAHDTLAPGGRVLMLYSNYAELVGKERANPICEEIAAGNRYELVSSRVVRVAPPDSATSTMKRSWQKELLERVETQLWELRKL